MHRSAPIESLETRKLLTAYTVNTLADSADGVVDGMLSLREAITAANTNAAFGDAAAGDADGDTIDFDPSLAGKTITLANGELSVTDDLAIAGNYVRLDGNGVTRILRVATSESFDLSDVILYQGAARNGGGLALSGGGTTSLDGVIFDNCRATGSAADVGGGAIYNADQTLSIVDSKFTANGGDGSGGVLLTAAGTVTIDNSYMAGNFCIRAGGAIDVLTGSVTVTDSALDYNTAGAGPGNGGAIHVTGDATVSIDSSSFLGNWALSEGGALWNSATGTMSVTNSYFRENHADGNDADNGGGAIFNNGGTLTVDASDLYLNRAAGTNGSGGGLLSVDGVVTVTDSKFRDNSAPRAGGGVEVIAGSLSIDNSLLTGNTAGDSRGATPGNGGALHVTGAGVTVDITDSAITASTAESEGAGLWNQAGSTLNVTNTKILSNGAYGRAADNGGGGIFNNGGTVNVDRALIRFNSANFGSSSGGGIFSTGGTVTVKNSEISKNGAFRAGGGVEIVDGTFTLDNSKLIDNNAGYEGDPTASTPGNGGGLHVTGTSGTVVNVINNSLVRGNSAVKEGGGLWAQAGSTMNILGSLIDRNTAASGGGVFNNGGNVFATLSTITANTATGSAGGGGFFTVAGGVTTILTSTVTGNTPDDLGGPGTYI